MASRRKTIGAALGGAAALSFGGYALGSQAGDGLATGASSGERGGERAPGPPGFGRGLDDLAERLGVETDALEQALEDMREEHGERRGDPREDLAAGLAEKLGMPEDDVSAALDKLHDGRHAALASALADELGLEADDVEAALDKALPKLPRGAPDGPPARGREGGPHARRAPLRRLARELGVSNAQLRDAFMAIRPDRSERDRFGPGAAELAEALGRSEEDVQAALDEVREQHEAEHDARRDEFASELAERLGIPVEKVREELPEAGPRGDPGEHRRGGPHGPPHALPMPPPAGRGAP
jgi:Clp amino terminal domain, pathogenicity island component